MLQWAAAVRRAHIFGTGRALHDCMLTLAHSWPSDALSHCNPWCLCCEAYTTRSSFIPRHALGF